MDGLIYSDNYKAIDNMIEKGNYSFVNSDGLVYDKPTALAYKKGYELGLLHVIHSLRVMGMTACGAPNWSPKIETDFFKELNEG